MIFFLFLVGIFIYLIYQAWTDGMLDGLMGLLLFMVSFLLALVLAVLSSGIGMLIFETEDRIDPPVPIYAIQFSSHISGNFFLGCGSIDNKEKYYFVRQYKEGQKIESVETRFAWVILDDTIPPNITTVNKGFKNEIVDKLLTPLTAAEYRITVPTGTIKYDYNIQLPN